jgi:hypothetical protein
MSKNRVTPNFLTDGRQDRNGWQYSECSHLVFASIFFTHNWKSSSTKPHNCPHAKEMATQPKLRTILAFLSDLRSGLDSFDLSCLMHSCCAISYARFPDSSISASGSKPLIPLHPQNHPTRTGTPTNRRRRHPRIVAHYALFGFGTRRITSVTG